MSKLLSRKLKTIGIGTLSAMVFLSAGLVVYNKHLSRELFNRLQQAHNEIEGLQVEWGQLLLEQGTWASDGRVDYLARQRLHMVLPEPGDVVVIPNSGT